MKRLLTTLSLCISPAAYAGYLECHHQDGPAGVMVAVAHQYTGGVDLGIFMLTKNARIEVPYTNFTFFEDVNVTTWSTLQSVKATGQEGTYILELSEPGIEKEGTLTIMDQTGQQALETIELSCRAEDYSE